MALITIVLTGITGEGKMTFATLYGELPLLKLSLLVILTLLLRAPPKPRKSWHHSFRHPAKIARLMWQRSLQTQRNARTRKRQSWSCATSSQKSCALSLCCQHCCTTHYGWTVRETGADNAILKTEIVEVSTPGLVHSIASLAHSKGA